MIILFLIYFFCRWEFLSVSLLWLYQSLDMDTMEDILHMAMDLVLDMDMATVTSWGRDLLMLNQML